MAIIKILNEQTGEYEELPVARGESAYEVAVRNGFEGTEEDWLASLSTPAEDTVGTEQIKDGAVTPKKTSFLKDKSTIGTKNFYDKNKVLDELLTVSYSENLITSSTSIYSFYVSVDPNETYTVEKISSSRFNIATTTDKPKANIATNQKFILGAVTKKTITTGENDNYLFVSYYYTSDTLTQDEIKDSIKIYKGTEWIDSEQKEVMFPRLRNNVSNLSDCIIKVLAYRQLGELTKGYLCLIADDGGSALVDYTIPMLKEKNVPCTFALMKDSEVIQNESQLDVVKDMINNYNCSICQHGPKAFSKYTEEELLEFLDTEKKFWNDLEIEVKGLCYPDHVNDEQIRVICGGNYGVCCDGNLNKNNQYPYQLNGPRSNIFELCRTSVVSYGNLKKAIDYAIQNNLLMIVFWHDISVLNNAEYQKTLENFIDYAKESGIEFITLNKVLTMI